MTLGKTNIDIEYVDYLDEKQAKEMGFLLNEYAKDPMGGGEALPIDVQENVALKLSKLSHSFSFIAYVDGQAAGLLTAFENFST
ncbi:MAG: GNAT family N-acetyltransferase, partial [Sulfurovum sp.]|nr:GNAT family N-acetyltransferase [Sulfurovum sp.]